ncbi:hypothetical protein SAMN04487944_11525 [Gracilibacillus ureilyticus]|uniref:Tubby C-terminal domain-containing protein n=1 Tax=Gracilibacillus ureilyticus TaxID=531814 RepID=A0A1H9TWV6_9BACI|nr:hypothetical protein [Gracilibacillus ureilyticus]SES01488.1 hypothetical protein SAMN04487944_11525 [Gracilibacillus ureilyticus]
MIHLNLLFILILLTLLARYLVFDAFEPEIFAMTFLFPIASIILLVVCKRFAVKEREYQPDGITGWSFYNVQKMLLIQKPLFKGTEKRGYIDRYFEKKWQYAVSDIFGSNWYLSMKVQIDGDAFEVRWYRQKWFTQQERWRIYKNDEHVGEARTLINLKNTAKLKEALEVRFGEQSYISSASTVTSTINLTHNEESVGSLKRNHLVSGIQVIDTKEDKPEYILALILHSYYFKSK